MLNKILGSTQETKCTVGYKMAAFVIISFWRSLSIFLWWIKIWAKVCWNGNKYKAHCTLSVEESNNLMKESNTASETPALTKKSCKLPGGMEGKYKWPRFEGRESKMFCEICREFPKRKNLQYSRGSEQMISKQTVWKHIHVSWGQWRTCFDQRLRKWNFFWHSILHVNCIFKTSVFYLPTVVFIAKKEWFVPWKHMHVHE